ncbi:hypothetical protein BACCIP111883_03264 [Sutcliffiella rhizosphaerae]|uniref:Uncharacterized protein n=1 Tax=Sutcliffiella rhizosphaerae TaxID=2880967 RepID=A0ABM8YR51_9BACI|nr:hypothetical protein BACCIP111883_03264 [Sutcliffiella rhizosphaerae]
MKNSIKIMLLGITVLLLSFFIHNISMGDYPSTLVQLIFVAGFITVIVGFLYKEK